MSETENKPQADPGAEAAPVEAAAENERLGKHATVAAADTAQPAEAQQDAAPSGQPTAEQSDAAQPAVAQTLEQVTEKTNAAIEEARKRRERNKRIGIGAVVAVVVALAVYAGGCYYYAGHFLPHTQIGSFDVSNMTLEEATTELTELSQEYALDVKGEGLDFAVTSADTGLRLDSQTVAQNALAENAYLAWPLKINDSQDLTDAIQATYDEEAFTKYVTEQVEAFNKDAIDPISASIAYSKKSKGFEVVPAELGTKLDVDAVLGQVRTAALRMDHVAEIGEGELMRPAIETEDPRLQDAIAEADSRLGFDVNFTLGGEDVITFDAEAYGTLVSLNDEVGPYFDPDKLEAWMKPVEDKFHTVGTERTVTTPDDEEITVSGGPYGWEIDHDAWWSLILDCYDEKLKDDVEIPCLSKAAVLPDKNGNDIGDTFVDVNLSTQYAVFYSDDEILWEADFISGSPDGKHDTPTGVYELNSKESPSKLIGEMIGGKPEYETTVQFWMPFVGNAIGFHDATWQPGFGGEMYASGYGSHGCVNLAYTNAEDLYAILDIGTPVLVHN